MPELLQARRDFLWQTGGGFAGLALAALLAEDGFFDSPASASPAGPHFAGKAKSVICLFMYGGVSQVDTWDPKPELSRFHGKPIPAIEYDDDLKSRSPGALLKSARTFRKHGQSGIEVSDFYPRLANHVDELAV